MRWVPPWLGCVSLLYPAWWCATAVISLRDLSRIRVTPLGVMAGRGAGDSWEWAAIAVVLGLAVTRIPLWPAFTGLLVATMGVAGWAMRMPWPAAVLLMAIGLRTLLRAAPESRYPGRALFLIAAFAAPLAAIPLAFHPPRSALARVLAPAICAAFVALVVSLRWSRMAPRVISWPTVGAGVVASLLVAFGTPRLGDAVESRRQRSAVEQAQTAVASLPALPASTPYRSTFFQRGVNFTAEFPDGYLSEGARQTLRMLPGYGVNAIALVPYGNISSPRRFGGGWESDEGIENLARVAHSLGMTVMLKPQLWGRTSPADFDAPDPKEWFEGYGLLVDHYATLAARIHADVLCLGTELAKMTRYEAEWRALIARARKQYRGPITYAAIQGPEFENLRFWDALDYIGLSNYYPLSDTLDTTAVVAKIEAVQRRFNKPVIFAEAGFSSFEAPQREPWDESPRRLSPGDQARCYEALFNAFYSKPWFQGVYWWKVGTNRQGGPTDGSHTPWGKPAMEVVKKWYTQGGR